MLYVLTQVRVDTLFSDLFNIMVEHKVSNQRAFKKRPNSPSVDLTNIKPLYYGQKKWGGGASLEWKVGSRYNVLVSFFTPCLLVFMQVRIDPNFTSVMMAIMVIEGLGRSLDPNLDILAYAKPCLMKRAHQSIREQVSLRLKQITAWNPLNFVLHYSVLPPFWHYDHPISHFIVSTLQ